MTSFKCKTCGKVSLESGHLCDPTNADAIYTCEMCGQQR